MSKILVQFHIKVLGLALMMENILHDGRNNSDDDDVNDTGVRIKIVVQAHGCNLSQILMLGYTNY